MSSVLALTPTYPAHVTQLQLSTVWTPRPPTLLRRQLNSVVATVLGDREPALTAFYHSLQMPRARDDAIFAATHAAYLGCFRRKPSDAWDRAAAQKVDRSIVRVYANKMKYVDAVVPLGFRPTQIVCVGGVDAHLAHELAKMYSLTRAEQALVLGEGDRRAEESRSDYVFARYTERAEGESWTHYQETIRTWASERLDAVSEVDMVVVCCAHEVPFFGTILSQLIRHMSSDAVVIINDHSVTTVQERVLLEMVHDFHRKVTCTRVLPILDRESLNADPTLDEDDRCLYLTKEQWEAKLKTYGLRRVETERSSPYWSVMDPTNLLK